ncbi:alpha/beta hydrolase family protein [Alteripontixanthobacter muriae]|uniref:hypothetical protein n=1 Tax=Alteripontixanthobacter muriae TaxID=2705546 RepID=UPI001576E4B5|nr:hypothetical protein [Alteripontixanthobacter muriae]
MALTIDAGSELRLLILPALFDEANRMRRMTVDTMRALGSVGIDTFLPDLPGCNESLAPLKTQTLSSWQEAAGRAAQTFGVTHALTIRGGALVGPAEIPCIRYAPVTGAKMLRAMLRARSIQAREAGREESLAGLAETGRKEGLDLSGWTLGAEMFRQMEDAVPVPAACTTIEQTELGSSGLWLRAEPGEDADQVRTFARLLAAAIKA